LRYLKSKSDDSFSDDASFSQPRVFEGPNLWERAIKGYNNYQLIKNVYQSDGVLQEDIFSQSRCRKTPKVYSQKNCYKILDNGWKNLF
jgi:hypothetical protein